MAKSQEVFTVFYAWQSDIPQDHCRHLIRQALDDAAELLNSDDSVPYRVNIDQDTQNEPGLCDIPATLLAKIDKAGAVVADLTFVAKAGDKHCSNPNVLFELGYAFRALSHERLICVLNEAHGPRSKQMFDLAHRRFPIAFKSSGETTRGKTVTKLASDLADALRPIVALGPRHLTSDDETRFESVVSDVQSTSDALGHKRRATPLTFYIHPVRYREYRWPNDRELRKLMRERETISGSHEFPPQQRGTVAMNWGIYNDIYGETWATTYSGLFWYQSELAVDFAGLPISERLQGLSPDPPTNGEINAGEWISFEPTLRTLFNLFQFASSYSAEFGKLERLILSLDVSGLTGKWVGSPHQMDMIETMGPAVSPYFSRRLELTAEECQQTWNEHYETLATDLFAFFSRDFRRIGQQAVRAWTDRFH